MEVIELICPQCGAQLELSADCKSCSCAYCGYRGLIDDDDDKNATVDKKTEKETEQIDKKEVQYDFEEEWNKVIERYSENYNTNHGYNVQNSIIALLSVICQIFGLHAINNRCNMSDTLRRNMRIVIAAAIVIWIIWIIGKTVV